MIMNKLSSLASDQNRCVNFDSRSTLRLMTCGSVDDGKSTLIGRLLFDVGALYQDQIEQLRSESQTAGNAEDIDFSLVTDGLEAEREQRITIDVAYRYFRTNERAYILADSPGHEQYTRNMASAASQAEVAIIVVDARKGLRPQTLRHISISRLLGVQHAVLAVNKIDLITGSEDAFSVISGEFHRIASTCNFKSVTAIPVSALKGDNISRRSENTSWYVGPTLVEYLQSDGLISDTFATPFRMPVQLVCRPNQDFRGYSGRVASGRIAVGDRIVVSGSGRPSSVQRLLRGDRDETFAVRGDSVTVQLADDLDVERGDILFSDEQPLRQGDKFWADVLWMSEHPLSLEARYILKLSSKKTFCRVLEVASIDKSLALAGYELAPAVGDRVPQMNQIARILVQLEAVTSYEAFEDNCALGGFILVNRTTHETSACGMIANEALPDRNVFRQPLTVSQFDRAELKCQTPLLVWLTGLSASGKSTMANALEARLHSLGKHTYLIDGDNLRYGLNADLGFAKRDRQENIRRAIEVAKLMMDAGLIVIASFVSPFRSDRQLARDSVGSSRFIEVFVDTPINIAEERDPKGLYKMARNGKLAGFTGIGSPYEPPDSPDLRIPGMGSTDVAVNRILDEIRSRRFMEE